MATTYEAIATVTVGSGGASSITFSSIPQTYTDLLIKGSARTGEATVYTDIDITLNGESARQWRYVGVVNGSVGSSSSTGFNIIGEANGTSTTASTFSSFDLYIPNYTSSNVKSMSSDIVVENNSSSNYLLALHANTITNSAAVTQIDLVPFSSQSFAQYSTATLYGIKNS
jgi:hypothetical protein